MFLPVPSLYKACSLTPEVTVQQCVQKAITFSLYIPRINGLVAEPQI